MNLTPTEKEVLRMLCEGMTPTEIIRARGKKGTYTMLTGMRKKFSAKTNEQMMFLAGKMGIDRCLAKQ